jgi:hypothetical protein
MYKILLSVLCITATIVSLGCSNNKNPLQIVSDYSQIGPKSYGKIDGTMDPAPVNGYTIPKASKLTKIFNLPAKTSNYILSLNARLENADLIGSSYEMRIKINGTTVPKIKLINKAQIDNYPDCETKYEYKFRKGPRQQWFNNATGGWSVFYSPDFISNNHAGKSPYGVVGGEATDYEFDITDYLANGNNIIEIIHLGGTVCNLIIAGLEIWHQTGSTTDVGVLPRNAIKTFNFAINSQNKRNFFRIYSRIIFADLAGFSYSMEVELDNELLTQNNLMNKPTIGNGYTGSTRFKMFCKRDPEGVYYSDNNSRFYIPYSPDFYSNNVSGGKYGVVGGEAYKWDFKIPNHKNIIGTHTAIIRNVNSIGCNLALKGIKSYEIFELN